MIKEAEDRKLLKKDSVIIEPTSGNTGIGLAAVAASRGYKVILTMPDTMSKERINLLKGFGAEVVLTDGSKWMKGAIAKAKELAEQTKHSFIPGQFTNDANPRAHYNTTGPELWNDLDGDIDIFVSGVGTGGTLSGVGKFLKERNPNIKVVAVEPSDSPVITKGIAGPHKLQGIGAGFIPYTLDLSIIDEVITVSTDDAYIAARKLAKLDGILVGISSGAALHAAKELAKKIENRGKKIVVILPDGGSRYLSTELYSTEEKWWLMAELVADQQVANDVKIEIKNVNFNYVDNKNTFGALKDINLTVKKGEFVCLLGSSGCGKSTLLSLLNGLNKVTSGDILIDGNRITGPGPGRAVVFQQYSLFPWLTAKGNVKFGIKQSGKKYTRKERDVLALKYLESVGLGASADKYPNQLSGGMQQRVAVARALALEADILLMDEPFGAIDPKLRLELQELVSKLSKENKKTVVFVTHDIDEAILLADRIVVMEPARIRSILPVKFPHPRKREDLINQPEYEILHRQLISLFYDNVEDNIYGEVVL